jgi:guanylate kinase
MKATNTIGMGNLYVIAAPSGTGKTTLSKALVDALPNLTVSISHTTRQKRPNEIQGVNYYFVDNQEFERLIREDIFLEHATIFDCQYGTSKKSVEETLSKGVDVILEIDWQGHQQIKKIFKHAIGIFILPPSLNDLRHRLTKRNQDAVSVIKKRIADVRETISHIHEFDYIVMNDDFVNALHDLKIIIEAGRLLQHKQNIQFAFLINHLLEME